MRRIRPWLTVLAAGGLAISLTRAGGFAGEPNRSEAESAAALIGRSELPGGMCVVVGRSDSPLVSALGQDKRFVVQALATGEDQVARSRRAIQEAGLYGRVSADRYDGRRLPYADNLINLVIVAARGVLDQDSLTMRELLRVVSPLGMVMMSLSGVEDDQLASRTEELAKQAGAAGGSRCEQFVAGGRWLKFTKGWPPQIDEWTHFLHGPDGNPVAHDLVVGPPRHYQWLAGPAWAQSHESDTSLRCLVTAEGRLYFLLNEAPTSLAGPESPPDKWFLEACDAFNGLSLWKRPIPQWGWREWKPSWFTPRPGVIPLNLDKRLVAAGQNLYVTLGFGAPVSELDGRTGAVLRTFEGTAGTSEILCLNASLVLTVVQDDGAVVKRVDLASGRPAWESGKRYQGTTVDYYRFTAMHGRVPPAKVDPTLDLAADGGTVALVDGDSVVALDFDTGRERWRTEFPLVKADYAAGGIAAQKKVWNGAMIVSDNVIVHASPNQMAAFSAQTGQVLWQQPKKFLQHLWYEWQDVFVIDGLVWTWSAELAREPLEGARRTSSLWPVSVNGYDLHNGELKREVPLGKIFKTYHHHRCYRNKATLRYILASRRGSEFVDLIDGHHTVDNWVRGACHMGMVPANGLQYAPPHPCECYLDEKLTGFNALASQAVSGDDSRPAAPVRLEPGPAFVPAELEGAGQAAAAGESDWPTFRADPARSGSVHTTLPDDLALAWEVAVGQRLGAPISVRNQVFVPLVDEHQIVALRAEDGREQWRFTAGARIDSPPTYDRGALLFGSADGWVYRVKAADGQLLWRLRGAPNERRIAAHGQIESAWPVSGSVLIHSGTAYFAAGRSSQLDGGIRLVAADARSGRVLHERVLSGPHYTVDTIEQNYELPMGHLPDVLFLEGGALFMRSTKFDFALAEQPGQPQLRVQGGFLDGAYFKRMPWSLGKSGHARVLVHDEAHAYGLRMFDSLQGLNPDVYFTPGKNGYLLFASNLETGRHAWAQRIPIRGRALLVADRQLCVAGPPDVVKPGDPLAAFEGRMGGVLRIVHTADGRMISEHTLPAPPVFHGAAAANHRLFLTLENGSVSCFARSSQRAGLDRSRTPALD